MTVQIERPAPHVAELVMNRPATLNALSTEQARRLTAALAEVAADDQVGVVILASALDRAYCVGADLKERAEFDDDELRAQRAVFVEAFGSVLATGVPMIAAVEGYAFGGGCELALACDLIVASESAQFALPEVGLGLIPGGGGTQLLPRRIGLNRAADLILTGRRVAADEALRIGLVDRVVPAGSARSSARRLAAEIAAKSPVSLRSAKQALRQGLDVELAAGMLIEDAAWRAAAFSPDRIEGVAAFVEKREPRWPSWAGADPTAEGHRD
ncbi:MAG TPA: enoyl-CoA hydratase-related protein [Propionibacteriaceae bacterium]|nr:enoyl-CoA hydratase-related protein [Propionibacteriaceae bacterium]